MGAAARRGSRLALACSLVLLAACEQSTGGGTEERDARTPAPAPRVALTDDDRERWAKVPSDRSVVPVLLYRGSEEILGGWRERVFSDITWGEDQLAFRVQGYRPLAFAPPYGNYGQAGTNDRRIPRELLARLLQSFEVVFTQDRTGLATSGAANPLGRIEVTRDVTEEELRALLVSGRRR
jgi:hypothetical protein